jgi:hypothetical protein
MSHDMAHHFFLLFFIRPASRVITHAASNTSIGSTPYARYSPIAHQGGERSLSGSPAPTSGYSAVSDSMLSLPLGDFDNGSINFDPAALNTLSGMVLHGVHALSLTRITDRPTTLSWEECCVVMGLPEDKLKKAVALQQGSRSTDLLAMLGNYQALIDILVLLGFDPTSFHHDPNPQSTILGCTVTLSDTEAVPMVGPHVP